MSPDTLAGWTTGCLHSDDFLRFLIFRSLSSNAPELGIPFFPRTKMVPAEKVKNE